MKKSEKIKYSSVEEKKFFLTICIVVNITLIFAMSLTAYLLTPKLKLEKEYIELNINEQYNKIEYKAYQMLKDLNEYVNIDGDLDTSEVGDYELVYSLNYDFFNIKKVLHVKVVDNESPILTLMGNEEETICDNKEYKEAGFSAIDNNDGDITANVEVNYLDNDIISYKVTDSSGNTSYKERKIIKEDKTGPTIKLNGDDTIYLTVGSTYKENKATVSDNCDGDLTSSLEIQGEVDTNTAGKYYITYSAVDKSGNKSEVVRTIIVEEVQENDKNSENTSGVIYLTFDDGPSSYTAQILDILKKYDIKATFFVTKSGSDSMILREYEEGHTIALHTYTHDWDIYKSMETYLDDLYKIQDRVKNITGIESKYVRFPGGSTNQKVHYRSNNTLTMKDIEKEIESRGFKYFDWNVCVEDAGACVSSKNKNTCVYDYFVKGLKPNRDNIVLLHDIKSYTADSLEDMIEYGLSKGFTFKNIDDSTTPIHF